MNETMTIAENPSIAKRGTVRLTTAQALVRYLSGLRTRVEGPWRRRGRAALRGGLRDFWTRQRGWSWGGTLPISGQAADLSRTQ